MWDSLQRILSLNPETKVYICHDYKANGTRNEFLYETTIGEQKKDNIHVSKGKESFIVHRKERDDTLSAPKLIHPSLQFNLTAGVPPKFVLTPVSASWYKKE